ncbi:hypothetical protein E1B28_002184 [Marasmius oreades]|nr:uncharacterized protein E1B28_002184 [Marasmius oreades]KAG7086218.1 hypothetical protein E1B28_002184 [Marasmius oreades]
MITSILTASTSQPRKVSELQFYQREYYAKRVKVEFDTHWETIKDRISSDCRVREMNAFTGRKWANEPEDFKKGLWEVLERNYVEEMEAWKKREDWTLDASGYKM